jgi:hypothetical protein
MGVFANIAGLFGRRNANRGAPSRESVEAQPRSVVTAAIPAEENNLSAFSNSNITYSSELNAVNYDSILRDKQRNINTLYQLADYYTDADPIVHGINKGVYVPFSGGDYYLTGENEKTIALFEEQYEKMRMREHIDEIFLQYYKYANVYVYIWNGNLMTLPPHKCRIGNTTLNGTPIVDLNVRDIVNEFRTRTYSVLESQGVKDDELETLLKGYPPEVAKAIRNGDDYAQLDPHNVFVMQGSKEGWMRYAIPWIASALPALARKELIGNYETALLNIGARAFVHAKYGDPKKDYDMLPDIAQLTQVRSTISSAMRGNPLAVTNHLVEAKVVQADLSDLYQWPMYEQVNADILSSGGIAGIIVNGVSQDGSTFASAQVSTQAAASRIEAARREFEELMYKVNVRLVEDIRLTHTNNLKDIPRFHFKPFDMSGRKALMEACEKLWGLGLVSTKTYLQSRGYNLANEKAQRETEAKDGTDDTMQPHATVASTGGTGASDSSNRTGKVGRPALTEEERTSDVEKSIRSKQAKDAADGDLSEAPTEETG